MTKEQKSQFTLRITEANATELVVILYDMALIYLEECRQAEEEDFANAVRKVRGCINELLSSLHVEYEVAQRLQSLYVFCIRRLAAAQQKKDTAPLEEVEQILRSLRDAYAQIAVQDQRGPVMTNAQTVYTGFTYGKKAALSEDLSHGQSGRGMLV